MELKKGQIAARNATIATGLLAFLKGVVGLLSGSLALLTDALHSTIDILTIFASFFGLKIAGKKPTEKFPYGYYKAESLASLFISLVIFFIAINFLIDGYNHLFILPTISFTSIAATTALTSIIVSLAISQYLKKAGEEINSQALLLNSKERKFDAFSSMIVFIAILSSVYKIPYIDGIVVILLALMIFKISLFSMKDSIYSLMDVSPSKEIEEKIKKIIKNTKGVDDFKNLKLRKTGPFVMGEVDVKIKKFVNVDKAHEISDKIENQIKKIKEIDSFVIHIEPYEKTKQRIAIPISENKGLNSKVMNHFGRANYFLFVDVDREKKKINKMYTKRNPFKKKIARAGLAAVHFLVNEKVDILVTKEIGEISFHTARDHLINIYKTKGKTAKEIINNFMNEKLAKLTEATRVKD